MLDSSMKSFRIVSGPSGLVYSIGCRGGVTLMCFVSDCVLLVFEWLKESHNKIILFWSLYGVLLELFGNFIFLLSQHFRFFLCPIQDDWCIYECLVYK